MKPQNKRPLVILLSVLGILMIPLLAMLFSNSVNWTIGDFVIAGLLLLGTGLLIELAYRLVKKAKHRNIIIIMVIILLLLIAAEIGVGLFGTPISGN